MENAEARRCRPTRRGKKNTENISFAKFNECRAVNQQQEHATLEFNKNEV